MFVNILNADDKCFLLNRDNFRQPIQMQLSEKQKKVFSIFSSNFEIHMKCRTFSKKR